MIAISALVLSLAAAASAAPSKRQDNGSCKALQSTCAASVKSDLSDAWNIKACVFGATCFGGQHPVDGFLAAVYAQKGGKGTAPASVNLPRVTGSLFNSIATDHKALTEQNFIDGYYSSLDASGGPYPTSASIVQSYYQRVATWTAFCTSAIPLQNFADYFQYSSTVGSNGCSAATSTVIAPTTTSSAPPATTTIPVISSDATCQKMFTTCIAQSDQKLTNPWSNEACLLGATCFGGQRPVDDFLAAVYGAKNPGSNAYPASLNEPRVSTSLFSKISTDGKSVTQQNFIDAYYSTLSSVGGPYPPNANLVISYFNRVLGWTAFCPGQGIPYMNFADYFEYSATVQGGSAQC
jgi:hypothetical protein